MKDNIRIALAQINSKRENKQANLKRYEELILKAKRQNIDLIIFPEMSLTGYVVKDQIYELSEQIPGPSVKKVETIAKKTGIHIIFGMPEISQKTKATLYNTAVLIGPKGYIGKYRKMYLPTHSVFEEKRYFRPGYQPAVFDTDIGKIGLTICYDIFFPEVFRLARLNA
jgi:predicted amidohydrolase